MPVCLVLGLIYAFTINQKATFSFLENTPEINSPATIVTQLNKAETAKVYRFLATLDAKNTTNLKPDLEQILTSYQTNPTTYSNLIEKLPIDNALKYESGWALFKHKIPMWIFFFSLIGIMVWTYKENLSLIPLLGLLSCLYMMAELSVWNWIYFSIWLLIGLVIYFGYSQKNSKLNLGSK